MDPSTHLLPISLLIVSADLYVSHCDDSQASTGKNHSRTFKKKKKHSWPSKKFAFIQSYRHGQFIMNIEPDIICKLLPFLKKSNQSP